MSERDLMFCADCSRQVGEQLFHTAPRADYWLLIEYDASWGAKALAESALPKQIKARLQAWQDRTPNAKVLFIKRASSRRDSARVYLAHTREVDPVLYRFDLEAHADLLTLDLDGITAGDSRFDAHRTDEKVCLVCTNGRRDAACSRYGTPFYHASRGALGEAVWQSTHVGGHRFAANLGVLPSVVWYGYLDAATAHDVAEAILNREVLVNKTRGRSCYSAPVQAADYYLRGATGVTAIQGIRLVNENQTGDQQWTVRLETPQDGRLYDVHVRAALSDWTVFESTGDTEPKHILQYHYVSHEEITPGGK